MTSSSSQACQHTDDLQNQLGSLYYASILASSDFLIISTDTSGIVTTFNTAAERALGYQAADIIGIKTPEYWHDAAELSARAATLSRELGQTIQPGFDAFVAKARLHGMADDNEWTLIRKNGSRFSVNLSVTCLRDTAGHIIGYLGVLRDITEQKMAQLKLQERDERLRKLAQQVPGMIYQFLLRPDGSSCFPYASEGIRDIYRVKPEQVATDASCVFALLHPDDYDMIVASITDSAATQQLWNLDYRVRFDDGVVRWLHGQAVPERLADGSTLWHGFITDITARKSAELELQQFKTLMQTLNDPVYLLSPSDDFRFHYANPALLKHYGLNESELLGKRAMDLDPSTSQAHSELLWAQLKNGASLKLESTHRHSSGTEIPVQLTASYLKLGNDEYIGGVILDISDRKHMEAKLREATEERLRMELKLAETAKLESLGVLAGGIAHDFNNILTGVLGNASLLQLELQPDSQAMKTAGNIERAALRAAELCKQMLAYSGRGRFVVRHIQLNKLIENTVRLLDVAASRHCVIRYDLAPGLPQIEGDETQIGQIILNLVINAAEAIGNAAGIISVSTSVVQLGSAIAADNKANPLLAPGEYIKLEITDSGCGMAPETVKRIFEPFFTTKFTGRGLGLAAVHGIIRGHKGDIEVVSEPGKGSTFRILLPSVTTGQPSVETATSTPVSSWHERGHILIADDDETVRDVASRILQSIGFTTETVGNGSEAVERFSANPKAYTMVLLDLTMPQMDGEEAFRCMQQIDPGVRVMLMSGYDQQEIDTRFAGSSLSGFIAKPLDVAHLVEAVQKIVKPVA